MDVASGKTKIYGASSWENHGIFQQAMLDYGKAIGLCSGSD